MKIGSICTVIWGIWNEKQKFWQFSIVDYFKCDCVHNFELDLSQKKKTKTYVSNVKKIPKNSNMENFNNKWDQFSMFLKWQLLKKFLNKTKIGRNFDCK